MLRNKLRSVSSLGLASFVLLMTPGLAWAKAKIVFKNGQEIEVDSIEKATWKEVVYRLAGTRQTAEASQVKDVVPDNRDLAEGINAFRARKLSAAISDLERAGKAGDKVVKAFASFYLGRAYRAMGQLAEAADAYAQVIAADAEHLFAPDSCYEGGECYLSLGKFADATKLFSGLERFGSTWKAKGAYGKATALLAQGKGDEAEKTFSELARSSSGEASKLAQAGQARAQVMQGKNADALIRTLMREKSTAVQGTIWVAQAEVYAKEGKSKEALLAGLRSLLVYGGEGSADDARRVSVKAAKALGGSFAGVADRAGNYSGESYTGDRPTVEFVTLLMRHISAGVAEEVCKEALKTAAGEEKADLEFLAADALRGQGKTAEFEAMVAELQKKYPNHARAKDAALDVILANKQVLVGRASKVREIEDDAKRDAERAAIQKEYEEGLKVFEEVVKNEQKKIQPLLDDPDYKKRFEGDNIEKIRRLDFIKLQRAEMVYESSKAWPKGDSKVGTILMQAYSLLDDFTLDAEQFSFDYLANAYKTKGLVLLDMGKVEEAMGEFSGLKEYVVPLSNPNPDIQKRLKEFETSIKISGYRLFATACVRAGQPQEAINAFLELEQRFPNYQNSREGLLAMFELTKCYAAAGRTSEALDKIYPLVENPNAITVEGVTPDALKVEATKALAGISEAAGGEIFPPAAQYAAGDGFKALGDDEQAIVGYKGVLTSAVTTEERERWVPQAVIEMGSLLYFQKRFLEAVLAYRVLFTEFPDHEKAVEAVKYARAAIGKALEVYKEDESNRGPIWAMKLELDEALKRISKGDATAFALMMQEAAKDQTAGRFVKAAEGYLQVPETFEVEDAETKKKSKEPVKFYANAVANAGYCYFRAYETEKKPEFLAKAEETLNKALAAAKTRSDAGSEALASFYLGEVANSKKDYPAALKALAAFDDRFATMDKFRARARAKQVEAYLGLEKPAEAEKRYDSVKDMDDSAVTAIALDLADWYNNQAEALTKASSGNPKTAEYRKRAAVYAADWIRRSKDLKRDYLFWAASIIVDGGLSKDAIGVYERLFKEFPRPAVNAEAIGEAARRESALQDQYDLARLNLARAYFDTEEFDKAEKAFADLSDLAVITHERTEAVKFRGALTEETTKQVDTLEGPMRLKVFSVKTEKGESLEFMVPPGKREPTVVKGTDGKASYSSEDYLILRPRFRSNFLVLRGLAESGWKVYEKSRDSKYLVDSVQKAWNALYFYLFKAVDESSYVELIDRYSLVEKNYFEARMKVVLRLHEISFERQDFKKIVDEFQFFESQGFFNDISEGLKSQFKAIKDKAASKG